MSAGRWVLAWMHNLATVSVMAAARMVRIDTPSFSLGLFHCIKTRPIFQSGAENPGGRGPPAGADENADLSPRRKQKTLTGNHVAPGQCFVAFLFENEFAAGLFSEVIESDPEQKSEHNSSRHKRMAEINKTALHPMRSAEWR